jgi:site-specific DNA-methyltransferase (adenine-specific)
MKMLKLTEIKEGKRGRKDYGNLDELIESIQKYGIIQPIVVRELEGDSKYSHELIAGGRRLRACTLACIPEVPCVLRDECSDIELKELELEENIQRRNLAWSEIVDMKLELDNLMQEKYELKRREVLGTGVKVQKPGVRELATALDESICSVSNDIRLAKAMREDPELKKKLEKMPKSIAFKKLQQIEERKKREEEFEKLGGVPDVDLRHGNCLTLIKDIPDSSINLIITDPPYAVEKIDEAKGSYNDLSQESDNSNKETMQELYKALFPELFRVLQQGAHTYIFYASEWYRFLFDCATNAGFIVDPVPLIWYKECTTAPFRGYGYQPTYEPILFMQKPPREKRQLRTAKGNLLSYKQIERGLKRHPYHKPPELLRLFIEQSSCKGESVLDPFTGSGETIKQVLGSFRHGIGFELDKGNYLKALEYLSNEDKDL